MKRNSLLPYALTCVGLVTLLLLAFFGRATVITTGTGAKSGGTSGSSLPQPPPTCHYCSTRLLNASPAEIGQFAVQYATIMHEASGDPPQVLLSRFITADDYLTLGLGCPPSRMTFEQPPLALVILKGDLQPQMIGTTSISVGVKYIAYVFDLWADAPTDEISSVDGGAFRKALNDPSLSDDSSSMPMVCPTPLPYKITLHYGEVAPTVDVPTNPVIGNPTPVPTLPSQTIPLPIPTTGP